MDERELVLTSLIYPLLFKEAVQVGIATPVSVHIRELLKIQTPEPEVTVINNPVPHSVSIRNIFQDYEHPLQDYARVGIATPLSVHIKNLFNEHIQPIGSTVSMGIATPVSVHQVNLLKNLQTFGADHVAQVSNAIPEAIYSTCKPVVFVPTNLRGAYNGTSIQLFWSNNSITHSRQNLYKSTTPFTENNLPPVYQYIFRNVNSYIDEDVTEGVTYYYAISTEAGLVQLVSSVIEITVVEDSNCDPYWDKVVALLHFDGNFNDETGGVVTTEGALTFTPGKFSEAVRFTRSVTPRTIIRKSGLNIGSGDFTIEAWVRLSSVSLDNAIFDFRLGEGISSLPLVESDGGNLYVWVNGSYLIGPISSAMSTSHFKHLALVRSSGVLSLWLDGVSVGEAPYTYDMEFAQVSIGRSMNTSSSNTSFDLVGDIDELRITVGIARYTENFTPPSEPFPNQGSVTTLLPEVIGEQFGGGYYIGDITIPVGPDAGIYAIIMAGVEGQATAHWKTSDTASVGAGSTIDGMINTLDMEADGLDEHPAAKYCRDYTGGGHNDWYLPAKDELNLAWINRSVLSELGMTYRYWSSTQGGSSTAWYQDFNDGHQLGNSRKNWPYSVRPVRRIRKS